MLKVVPANTEDFQINFAAFEEMLTDKVAAVLINTPNNPSGIAYSTKTIEKLAEVLTRKQKEYGHDIFLISDELPGDCLCRRGRPYPRKHFMTIP